MSHAALAWRAERANFQAFPALRQEEYRGWLLGFSRGSPRRTNNSASPLGADCADIEAVIDAIEARYQQHGLPTLFRVPSLVASSYDRALAARGYARESDSCILYGAVRQIGGVGDPGVELRACPTDEWFTTMREMQGYSPEEGAAYRRIVVSIVVPAAFAGMRIDGSLAALAYGAVHEGLLCYESVFTERRFRRQGLARRILRALAAWGHRHGATGACLQVEASNAPACKLYHELGLKTELYRYHYRRAPVGGRDQA